MKRPVSSEGVLWTHWLAQQKHLRNRIVLIDAPRDESFTANVLTEAALGFSDALLRYHPGERIAFRLPNGPEWMALFLALQRAGLAAVPLDGSMPNEGCLETARSLGASAVYLDGEFHSLGKATKRNKKYCCVKLTSGSGGLPKAIECSADHLIADGRNIIQTMGIKPRDLNLAAIPLGHSYGLGNLVMPLILQGTAMVTASAYVPRQLIEWTARYGATVFPAVPALFRVLASLPHGQGNLDSLRTIISAGAMLPATVAQAFFDRYGIKIHNFYGSSETGAICYDKTGNASLSGRSVGKPFAGVSVKVKSGRITIKSKAVATRSGRWHPEDRGEWNKFGELVLLGRVGRGANIGGKKVHPLEVERLIRGLAGVTDTAVWLEHAHGRDFLVAGVETTKSRAAIESLLSTQLPAWKMPKTLFVLPELPRTSRGKIDLAALKRKTAAQP